VATVESYSRSVTERLVVVGRVGKPHGLDGAFLVDHPSDDPRRFAVGAKLIVAGAPTEVVLSRRVGRGRVAVKLSLAVSRGAEIAVRATDLPPPDPDSWYAFQLIGLRVEEEGGRALGEVVDVYPGVANDNIELDDKTLVPLIDDAVVEVDPVGGRIVVRRGFLGP
jgi:16S rRNA processing protein RimM